MYGCMYVCMYVSVCMYGWMDGWMDGCIHERERERDLSEIEVLNIFCIYISSSDSSVKSNIIVLY